MYFTRVLDPFTRHKLKDAIMVYNLRVDGAIVVYRGEKYYVNLFANTVLKMNG